MAAQLQNSAPAAPPPAPPAGPGPAPPAAPAGPGPAPPAAPPQSPSPPGRAARAAREKARRICLLARLPRDGGGIQKQVAGALMKRSLEERERLLKDALAGHCDPARVAALARAVQAQYERERSRAWKAAARRRDAVAEMLCGLSIAS